MQLPPGPKNKTLEALRRTFACKCIEHYEAWADGGLSLGGRVRRVRCSHGETGGYARGEWEITQGASEE
jgi:hypothetical protein